jgi:Domain of unknown function (DUF1877)
MGMTASLYAVSESDVEAIATMSSEEFRQAYPWGAPQTPYLLEIEKLWGVMTWLFEQLIAPTDPLFSTDNPTDTDNPMNDPTDENGEMSEEAFAAFEESMGDFEFGPPCVRSVRHTAQIALQLQALTLQTLNDTMSIERYNTTGTYLAGFLSIDEEPSMVELATQIVSFYERASNEGLATFTVMS